jgi:uncharacterized membrane protein YdbT with pleckstrin-like domain
MVFSFECGENQESAIRVGHTRVTNVKAWEKTMAYVGKVLLPGETVIMRARLHWIIYLTAFLLFLGGSALVAVYLRYFPDAWPLLVGSGVIYGIAVAAFVRAWFIRWITEFAVTNLRVIYKKGFIWRRTVEMNMDMVVSVLVDQSVAGRILGYGTLHVLGAGQGIEHLHDIASPLKIRTAIIANEHGAAARLHLGTVPLRRAG